MWPLLVMLMSPPTPLVDDTIVVYYCETDQQWYSRVGPIPEDCWDTYKVQDGHIHCHWKEHAFTEEEVKKLKQIIGGFGELK